MLLRVFMSHYSLYRTVLRIKGVGRRIDFDNFAKEKKLHVRLGFRVSIKICQRGTMRFFQVKKRRSVKLSKYRFAVKASRIEELVGLVHFFQKIRRWINIFTGVGIRF